MPAPATLPYTPLRLLTPRNGGPAVHGDRVRAAAAVASIWSAPPGCGPFPDRPYTPGASPSHLWSVRDGRRSKRPFRPTSITS